MKKVLILCTGNSCRSIIAEGLINRYLKSRGIEALSAGSNPTGRVHPLAKRVLVKEDAWDERYHSKSIEEVLERAPFDLVVTVCDNAKESCPMVAGVKSVHMSFADPDGKGYEVFVQTKEEMKGRLLPFIEKELEGV